MGKLSELAKTPPKREYGCMLTEWSLTLDDEDRELLWKMVADPEWPVRTVWRTFREVGFPGSNSVIAKHRDNGCSSCRTR